MTRYKLEHQARPGEADFDPYDVDGVLPRVGEYVEREGILYTVIVVFHFADGRIPQVRVRL